LCLNLDYQDIKFIFVSDRLVQLYPKQWVHFSPPSSVAGPSWIHYNGTVAHVSLYNTPSVFDAEVEILLIFPIKNSTQGVFRSLFYENLRIFCVIIKAVVIESRMPDAILPNFCCLQSYIRIKKTLYERYLI
jgi:hypothetical protein